MQDIRIKTEEIQLDQFLKWANLVSTGGEAKSLIQAGKVRVNGEIDTRRSHKLSEGDLVEIAGQDEVYRVIRE
ncbi:MAG: ribosome-associated protein [Halanaerobiales bacterium]|nr:ribosome-associated protein [Halanaerobiales bacterium]